MTSQLEIDQFEFGGRVYNALKREGVTTIAELRKLTREDFLQNPRWRNVHLKSWLEIKDALDNYDALPRLIKQERAREKFILWCLENRVKLEMLMRGHAKLMLDFEPVADTEEPINGRNFE